MDLLGMITSWIGAFLTASKPRGWKFLGFLFFIAGNISWITWASMQAPVIWTVVGQASVFMIFALMGVWNHRPCDTPDEDQPKPIE